MSIRHVVLDRDGVLNVEDPAGGYVLSAAAFRWTPGALQAVALLREAGLTLSVATNQRCVALGLLSEAALSAIHERIRVEASITDIYVCPHDRDAGCRCRKPAPGLLEQAIAASGVPANETVFIGDSATDLAAAHAAGVAGWLVRTGKGRATEAALTTAVPTYDDLLAAARVLATR
ncbi:MAG: HAD-IIIA family hydrolase [Myxococcota bacterium]